MKRISILLFILSLYSTLAIANNRIMIELKPNAIQEQMLNDSYRELDARGQLMEAVT